MTGNAVVRKRRIEGRAKVKTGCTTCRIRKIKCDETRPFCNKCVNTGRTCDGYQSSFKEITSQAIIRNHARGIKPDVSIQRTRSPYINNTFQDVDIDLLSRYLSTKTLFDIKVNLDEEARQILQASLIDPSIQHAVSSLRALRQDLEAVGDGPSSIAQPTPSFHYGLEQYSIALGGLASNLSSPSSNALKSALICCQIFISIEQVQKNYAAMAQHIIRGLRIMHEYRARPSLDSANIFVPAYHDQLPLLDVFVIKLFIAPCKFADRPAAVEERRTPISESSTPPHPQPIESRELRTLAPDMRPQLARIAELILGFLGKVSQAKSLEFAILLLSEKAVLLESLNSWLIDLDRVQRSIEPPSLEPISVCFLRIFHTILEIVMLGALQSSPEIDAVLCSENDRLQDRANKVGERVRTYVTCTGAGTQQYTEKVLDGQPGRYTMRL